MLPRNSKVYIFMLVPILKKKRRENIEVARYPLPPRNIWLSAHSLYLPFCVTPLSLFWLSFSLAFSPMFDSSIFLFHSPFFSCDMFESSIRHTLRTQWNWLDGHVMEAVGCVPCTKRSVAIDKKRETWKVGTRRRTQSYCNVCATRRPTYVDFIPYAFIFCTGAVAVRSSLHRPLYVNKMWEVQMAGKIRLLGCSLLD